MKATLKIGMVAMTMLISAATAMASGVGNSNTELQRPRQHNHVDRGPKHHHHDSREARMRRHYVDGRHDFDYYGVCRFCKHTRSEIRDIERRMGLRRADRPRPHHGPGPRHGAPHRHHN